jgi:methionyl-tRNA formyltransferase
MLPKKIIFAGTPDFAVPPLRALIASGHQIAAVYTQPDRPAGRGRKLTESPVKKTALEHQLPVRQPHTLREQGAAEELRSLEADLMIVVAYGLLLPQAVLDAPRLGCVNVHASLLPRWRGAAPIQRAILAGDRETGVTIMSMEAGLDTGPMFLARRAPIRVRETGGSLHDKLSELGAEALMDALPGILDGTLKPEPQDDVLATYAKKLSKDEAIVDWTLPAEEIDRMIRAFDPWPVAQTRLVDMTLRLWASETRPMRVTGVTPGRVIKLDRAGIDVATGEGVLRITRLQPPGKRPMTAADFLNARNLDGAVFG